MTAGDHAAVIVEVRSRPSVGVPSTLPDIKSESCVIALRDANRTEPAADDDCE